MRSDQICFAVAVEIDNHDSVSISEGVATSNVVVHTRLESAVAIAQEHAESVGRMSCYRQVKPLVAIEVSYRDGIGAGPDCVVHMRTESSVAIAWQHAYIA